jgi:hypothetical protein
MRFILALVGVGRLLEWSKVTATIPVKCTSLGETCCSEVHGLSFFSPGM